MRQTIALYTEILFWFGSLNDAIETNQEFRSDGAWNISQVFSFSFVLFPRALACVAGVRKGRGTELGRQTTCSHAPKFPLPLFDVDDWDDQNDWYELDG